MYKLPFTGLTVNEFRNFIGYLFINLILKNQHILLILLQHLMKGCHMERELTVQRFSRWLWCGSHQGCVLLLYCLKFTVWKNTHKSYHVNVLKWPSFVLECITSKMKKINSLKILKELKRLKEK